MRQWSKHSPLFAFLLPLFFVVHAASDYFSLIPSRSLFLLAIKYIAIASISFGLFYWVYNTALKAALAVFVSLLNFFFFGYLVDALKSVEFISVLSRYTIIIPVLLVVYLFSLFRIFRTSPHPNLIQYLNVLFLILLLLDLALIGVKHYRKPKIISPPQCLRCPKPDIFFIVVDGYAGQDQLAADFGFSNSAFVDSLSRMGFQVARHSYSNYTRTEFSMASQLNMEYHELSSYEVTPESLNYCFGKIASNRVAALLQSNGYEIVNNSIFDFANKPAPVSNSFLNNGIDLVESQTFFGRIRRDVYVGFVLNYLYNTALYKKLLFEYHAGDSVLTHRLLQEAGRNVSKPRFVYTHFLLTHFPYFYNEDGSFNQLSDIKLTNYTNKELYLNNLKGVNKKLLGLLKTIRQTTAPETIIFLVSDHGYRYSSRPENSFSTINAISYPSQQHAIFYDSISSVNNFRVLFNSMFNQSLALLKDKNGQVPISTQKE